MLKAQLFVLEETTRYGSKITCCKYLDLRYVHDLILTYLLYIMIAVKLVKLHYTEREFYYTWKQKILHHSLTPSRDKLAKIATGEIRSMAAVSHRLQRYIGVEVGQVAATFW